MQARRSLYHQLPQDAPTCAAERSAHRDLARACYRASEQQVRDVGTRDEENERDRAHQGGKDRKIGGRSDERLDPRREPSVGLGMGLAKALGDGVDLSLCGRQVCGIDKSGDDAERARVARVGVEPG